MKTDLFRQLPMEAIIKALLTEGHPGTTIMKVTRSYHAIPIEMIRDAILKATGGQWPKSHTTLSDI